MSIASRDGREMHIVLAAVSAVRAGDPGRRGVRMRRLLVGLVLVALAVVVAPIGGAS